MRRSSPPSVSGEGGSNCQTQTARLLSASSADSSVDTGHTQTSQVCAYLPTIPLYVPLRCGRASGEHPSYLESRRQKINIQRQSAKVKFGPELVRSEADAGAEIKSWSAEISGRRTGGLGWNGWRGQIRPFQTPPQPRRVNKPAVCLIYGARQQPDGHYCLCEGKKSAVINVFQLLAGETAFFFCPALFVSLASQKRFLQKTWRLAGRVVNQRRARRRRRLAAGRLIFASPHRRLCGVINHHALQR